MSLNNRRLIMKKPYIAPECDNFDMSLEINFMLTLSVTNEETEIVGANRRSDFEEENTLPSSSSLWDE